MLATIVDKHMDYLIIFFYKKMNNSTFLLQNLANALSPRGDARCCCWQPLKERTLNIPLFKEDFCSNIQGKQGGKLFGKSWKKISHQNEVETRLVQVMIDAPFDSRVY